MNMNNLYLYDSPIITTPYKTSLKLIFADDTASGRPCKLIDKIIQDDILPYYSNTHSNAYCGMKMKEHITESRDIIRKLYNLTPEHKIIFTGNGATGAINHLANSLDYKIYKQVYIYISIFEHYSNHLPWLEMAKIYDNIQIKLIPINIDTDWLKNQLLETTSCDNMNIVSITGCSNVSGVITDLQSIINIMNIASKKIQDHHNFLFVDCACLAPHRIFDCSKLDAVFISMHKFLGGTSSSGILIAKKSLFGKGSPYNPGGGCVRKIENNEIIYENDIEEREEGGTPNIVGIIRIKYVLQLHEKNYSDMIKLENELIKYINSKITLLKNKYSNFILVVPSNNIDKVPIVSFIIKNLHFNFVVVLLNDLFGIQSRGGISCCGLLGEYMKQIDINYDGWCRITFNWLMPHDSVDYILKAIEFVIKFGHLFISHYNKSGNIFRHNQKNIYNIPNEKLFRLL